VATLQAELTRKGPGVLLRDIQRGKDKQIAALHTLIQAIAPDVLLLTKVDFDLEHRTANALKKRLAYKYHFARTPNSMHRSQHDLDGDGQTGDRQTWARYGGEGGMLLMSKHPVELLFHLDDFLWKDLADPQMATDLQGEPFPSKVAQSSQRLVSQGFWVVRVLPPARQPVTLVLFHNQTPVFDGSEDLNGLRNRAQLSLVQLVMDGAFGTFPKHGFIVMGNANLDPERGSGDRNAIAHLLGDKRLQDARPLDASGRDDTVVWEKAGAMRVSYILPSADWQVSKAETIWPQTGPLRRAAEQASRHRMIWLDIKQRPE